MLLVQLAKVNKDYAGNPVLDEVDLEVLDGERIGLVGENGGGKSTLLKLIAGLETPTEGVVSRKRNLTTGHLEQEANPLQASKTVFEAAGEVSPEATQLAARLHELEAQMADPRIAEDTDTMTKVLDEYGVVQEKFDLLGGYALEHKVESVLHGLGFNESQYSQQVGTLSGGEKKLVNLARLLLQMPDLLLLDEPDNHLDIEAKAWLETFIQGYPGTVLIISHDRYLLDRTVKKIFQLEDGRLDVYAGNYSYYFEERQRRLIQRQEMYTQQQDEIKRLEALLVQLRGWAKQNDKFAPRMRSMEKRVERARQEASERPVMVRGKIKLDFDSNRSGVKVLEVKGVGKTIGERVLFKPFDLIVHYRDRVGIVGANGSGKTTLLKTIVGWEESGVRSQESVADSRLLTPESGTVKMGPSVVLGYYAQEQDTLPLDRTPMEYVRGIKPITEQQTIGLLRKLLFSYTDMHNTIRHLSGGEKSRLQMARLMLTDANFLVLDEPTNNLDLASIEVLEAALEDFDGTILAVSHDRYFLDKIVTRIVEIAEDCRVREYAGNYSYYLEKR
jgi:ATP-binding cassette, subfamily F, member 3